MWNHRRSAASSTLLYDVDFAYAKNTDGRNTIRRTEITLPGASRAVTFDYGSSGSHADDASRVETMTWNEVVLVEYGYLGVGTVMGIEYPEPDLFGVRYNPADTDDYRDLDRFNRVVQDRWYRDLTTDLYFFDHQIAWDRNSNVTLVQDEVFDSGVSADMDTEFTMDDLNRLTRAQWGTYTTSIGSEWRDQNWVLDQAGNWEDVNLDIDADGLFTTTGEYDDDRVHENANNITERDTDDSGGAADFDLVYNKRGDLTDDDEHFEYVWDAFGRLKQVKNLSSTLVAEYTYNGLNHLIVRHEDTDDDGDADGSDTKFRHVYDDQWRIIATYRESDSDPKEQFVFHNAGADGFGGSSYIDAVILRDKDANTAWTSAADGTLEDRVYYVQNWRADVSVTIHIDGSGVELAEWVRYDAYGTPYGIPHLDTNGDGTVDSTDQTNVSTNWWGSGAHPTGDHDLDHDVDVADLLAVLGWIGDTMGWGALSFSDSNHMNRKGYAGYEHLESLAGGYTMWHVRYRVLNSELGRWISRDPLEFIDGVNVYSFVMSNPITVFDTLGLQGVPIPCSVDYSVGSPLQQTCCKEANALRRSFGYHIPAGYVICCYGRSTICLDRSRTDGWWDNIDDSGLLGFRGTPPPSPTEIAAINWLLDQFWNCVVNHECTHISEIDCKLKPRQLLIPTPFSQPNHPNALPWLPWVQSPACAEYNTILGSIDCVSRITCNRLPQRLISLCNDMKQRRISRLFGALNVTGAACFNAV